MYKSINADVNRAKELPQASAQGHCCTCHLSTQARLCLMPPNHKRGIWFRFRFIYVKPILSLKENLLTSETQNGFGIYAVPVNRKVWVISHFTLSMWNMELSARMKPGLLDLPLYFCPCLWMLLLSHLSLYLPNVKREPREPEEKCVWEENVLQLIVQLLSACWKELNQNVSKPTDIIIKCESLFWKEQKDLDYEHFWNIIDLDGSVLQNHCHRAVFGSFLLFY